MTDKNVSHAMRVLGYPCRPIIRKWIAELAPEEKTACRLGRKSIKYNYDEKIEAVATFHSREKSGEEIANDLVYLEAPSTSGRSNILEIKVGVNIWSETQRK